MTRYEWIMQDANGKFAALSELSWGNFSFFAIKLSLLYHLRGLYNLKDMCVIKSRDGWSSEEFLLRCFTSKVGEAILMDNSTETCYVYSFVASNGFNVSCRKPKFKFG